MFRNKNFPTLYRQSYGSGVQVRNYSNSYTFPDFKLSTNKINVYKDINCKINACFATNLGEQDVDTRTKNQTVSQENILDCSYGKINDMKACLYDGVHFKKQLETRQIQLLNVNASEFWPGDVKNQMKSGCNIFAKVFVPKSCVNGNRVDSLYTNNMANELTICSNIKNFKNTSFELCNENIKAMNGTKTLSKYNNSTRAHIGPMVHESTPVLNRCEIHDPMGSTSVRRRNIIFDHQQVT